MAKKVYIVPIVTSYYEYERVEADSPEEAVARVKDGAGDSIEHMKEWREVTDILDDMVIEEK